MITDELKCLRVTQYVVIYGGDGYLNCSEFFSSYEDALAWSTSNDGAGDDKAIIVAAGSDCSMQAFEMQIEWHT
jgi:hypothetical protein